MPRPVNIEPMDALPAEPDIEALEVFLDKARNDHGWPSAGVNACPKWLRPKDIKPPRNLVQEGRLLTDKDSSTEWGSQLRKQGEWPNNYNVSFHQQQENRLAEYVLQARAHVGGGIHDYDITLAEWCRAVENIKASKAPTPTFIHRLVLRLEHAALEKTARLVQRLGGPAILAMRPRLWRFRLLSTKYKKGAVATSSSFRFLGISDLHGLVQETIILVRFGNSVDESLLWFQTGYRFDVANHQLSLSVLQDSYVQQGRSLFMLFGDFVHAFPRSWRAPLLIQLKVLVGISDGAFTLAASIMEFDVWLILLSGLQRVLLYQGAPEGSKYGPKFFNLLPDTLIRRLVENGCGVASSGWTPASWCEHSWVGQGSPVPGTVARLLAALREELPLPGVLWLAQHPDNEASASRALDLLDSSRVPILFHCDDPIFPASSRGSWCAR